eukprot:CAMPEP_0195520970 /NCGR_PEP_ID=MMETSP0794_2-20130614/17706_1 /TAXON_ID=515487 /ORGANISM="Stephanopyxis turris, Strain CCMP 815" /LENGTH=244 /DNA_ID=CAMNT_0040650419 /DNA_START=53 /DNA_END=787 /DNA_ORIENTATION=+
MALVNIVNMVVLDNPTYFSNPFQFEITFECLQELDDDLEWKVLYVGSAEDSTHDQTLDEVLVGPVPVGVNKFVLQADAPDFSSIPENDILGVTVVLVTCSYKDQEFTRVGYYVNNEYAEQFDPEVGPPKPLDSAKVMRQILADKPRVTRFPIDWGSGVPATTGTPQEGIQTQDEDGEIDNEQNMNEDTAEESIDMEQDEEEEEEEEEADDAESVEGFVEEADEATTLKSGMEINTQSNSMITAE